MRALNVGLTVLGTYLLATFLQAFLHRLLGHGGRGGWFRRTHLGEHHSRYGRGRLAALRAEPEATLTPFYAGPALACGVLAWNVLPRPLFWAHAATFAIVFALQVYVHDHFHLRRSWLNRFARFRTLRRLHYIHHLKPGRNYSVLEPLWDRVLGTSQRRRSAA